MNFKIFLLTMAIICSSLAVILHSVYAEQKNYVIPPNTIGIGLQQDTTHETFESSDTEYCIPFHLGNPWATNLTAWIVTDGDLGNYFTRNQPEKLFVYSGIFRYNSSCCLLEMDTCFRFPYVLETTIINGRVASAYTKSGTTIQGTGSAAGSSVAYLLTITINPPTIIELGAGEKRCIDFFVNNTDNRYSKYNPILNETINKTFINYCFKSPYIIFKDIEKKEDIGGHKINVKYKNNLLLIILILGVILIPIIIVVKNLFFNKKIVTIPKEIDGGSSSTNLFI